MIFISIFLIFLVLCYFFGKGFIFGFFIFVYIVMFIVGLFYCYFCVCYIIFLFIYYFWVLFYNSGLCSSGGKSFSKLVLEELSLLLIYEVFFLEYSVNHFKEVVSSYPFLVFTFIVLGVIVCFLVYAVLSLMEANDTLLHNYEVLLRFEYIKYNRVSNHLGAYLNSVDNILKNRWFW